MIKKFLIVFFILALAGCHRLVDREVILSDTREGPRIIEHLDNGDYLVTAGFVARWISDCMEFRNKDDCEEALLELLVAEYPDGTWRVKAQLVFEKR